MIRAIFPANPKRERGGYTQAPSLTLRVRWTARSTQPPIRDTNWQNAKLRAMKRFGVRRIAFALWLFLWPLLLAIHFYPIRVGAIRLLIVVVCALLWIGILWLSWGKKPLRVAFIAAIFFGFVALILPGRNDDVPITARRIYARLEKL